MKELKIVEKITDNFKISAILSFALCLVANFWLILIALFILIKALYKWTYFRELTNNIKRSAMVALGLYLITFLFNLPFNLLYKPVWPAFIWPSILLDIVAALIILTAIYKWWKRKRQTKSNQIGNAV